MIFPSLRRVAFAGSLVFTASAISAAAQTLVLNDANATTLRGGLLVILPLSHRSVSSRLPRATIAV